jgi:hypothetical protein
MKWPYGEDEGPSPEQERAIEDDRQARIAWCRAHDIDPFDIVCDGGIEAWEAVTDHELMQAAAPPPEDETTREGVTT